MEASDSAGGLRFTALGSQGRDYEALTVKAGGSAYPMCPVTLQRKYHLIELDGRKTAAFAVRTLLRRANQAVVGAGLTWDDIELFIPHQANLRLIELASQKLNVPMERIFVNVDRYANMSTASIPVALTEAADQGRLKQGDHVLLLAFGAGLAWAAAIIEWGTSALDAPGTSRLRRAFLRVRQAISSALLDARLWLYELSRRLKHRRRRRMRR